MTFLSTYKPVITFMLRSFTTIVLPLILSLLMLHDCGKLWTMFWKECLDTHDSSKLVIEASIPFVIETSNIYSSTSFDQPITMKLLSPDKICNPVNWRDINWNKCLRQ
eukprot:300812_1